MQFIIFAYDGTDPEAQKRRAAVRDDHLKMGEKMYAEGKWIFAAGIVNDVEQLIGSMIVCEFATRAEMEELWLSHEPYITGNVWKKIEVHRAGIPPFIAKK